VGYEENAYGVLVGKAEVMRPPGRLRHRREDSVKLNIEK
jgi:hypothetical protein